MEEEGALVQAHSSSTSISSDKNGNGGLAFVVRGKVSQITNVEA